MDYETTDPGHRHVKPPHPTPRHPDWRDTKLLQTLLRVLVIVFHLFVVVLCLFVVVLWLWSFCVSLWTFLHLWLFLCLLIVVFVSLWSFCDSLWPVCVSLWSFCVSLLIQTFPVSLSSHTVGGFRIVSQIVCQKSSPVCWVLIVVFSPEQHALYF